MSDYNKITDYSAKDALSSGDSVKRVKGSEIGADFDAVAVAVATKANSASPVFTGVSSFAVGAVGAPSIYMTGYATTGWYNIGANNWGFAVSGAKVLDVSSTGLAVTGGLSATGVANFLGGGLGLTIRSNGLTTEEFNGTDSILVNYNGYLNGTTQFRNFQVFNGKQGLIGDFSPTGLAVTGTLSSTGDYKIAGTGIYNATATNTSLGLFADTNAYAGIKAYGSSHATKANVTELLAGTGVIVGSVSSTGLAVTGALSATGVANFLGGGLGLTIRSNGLTTEEFNGTDSILVNYNGYLNGTTQFRNFQVFNGKQGLIGVFSSTGLAINGDISVSTKTPASAGAAGVAGTITWDSSYIYVCTATNTWKRAAIATW